MVSSEHSGYKQRLEFGPTEVQILTLSSPSLSPGKLLNTP